MRDAHAPGKQRLLDTLCGGNPIDRICLAFPSVYQSGFQRVVETKAFPAHPGTMSLDVKSEKKESLVKPKIDLFDTSGVNHERLHHCGGW